MGRIHFIFLTAQEEIGEVRRLQSELAEQRKEIETLKTRLVEWDELEASICPEDVGFDEFIESLLSKIEELRKQVEEVENLKSWNEMLESATHIHADNCTILEKYLQEAKGLLKESLATINDVSLMWRVEQFIRTLSPPNA